MANVVSINLLLWVLCLSVLSINGDEGPCKKSPEFDYIYLSAQWSESLCKRSKCKEHLSAWVLNSASADQLDGSGPIKDCCYQEEVTAETLEPIRSELNKYWPSVKEGVTNEDLWLHQYRMRGSCANNSSLFNGVLDYFRSTLIMFKLLNIRELLSDAGITMSSSQPYNIDDFHYAIQQGFGYNVVLDCVETNHFDKAVIFKINFCFDKGTLEPFNCPWKHNRCDKLLYYPDENNLFD